MSKRTVYTNITPLPPQVTRQIAVDELHDHGIMIKLNPLVIGFERTTPHKDAPADEYHCIWYEITDKVSYLPGIKGQVKYKACFFDRPVGLQTHCYAPTGLDIKAKWSIGGNMPGEPREARELGVETPRDGLYLREEVDMRCNIMMTSFVKKNLKNAHQVLVERLLKKVEMVEEVHYQRFMTSPPSTPGTHPQQYLPQRSDGSVVIDDKKMYNYIPVPGAIPAGMQPLQQHPPRWSANDIPGGPPPHYWQGQGQVPDQKSDWNMPPPSQRSSYLNPSSRPQSQQYFAAELPGSNVTMPAELYSPPMPASNKNSSSPRQVHEKDVEHGSWAR